MIPYIRKQHERGAARTEAAPDPRRERSPVLTFVMLAAAALLIIGVFGSGTPL
ncbi:hypothetical protein [Salipiger mangrovisoli]|uniref:Uncharacterized protein n=1 Tax=Salipiger mangrovisoli TaxID=2865933 RepID=A0ABR9X708_9RHOB|nr:hypothetical protein [Salipiger mangrovisoli]MBE9639323.1 hypothetical protein [Salipiger mangrovisoli]